MTKKIKKKTTTKKPVSKKPVKKKATLNKEENFGSTGILILGIIGIVVLIYFGINTDVEFKTVHTDIEEDKKTTIELKTKQNKSLSLDKAIMIDGLIYPSKEYALTVLKDLPQTKLTEEQRAFVINPDKF
jgi:hypothetical protein